MKTSFSPVTRLALILAIFFSSVVAVSPSSSAVSPTTDTQQILDDLGGIPCLSMEAHLPALQSKFPSTILNPQYAYLAGCICCPACLPEPAKGCSSQQQADLVPRASCSGLLFFRVRRQYPGVPLILCSLTSVELVSLVV